MEEEVSLHDYLWVISKRRWIIAFSFLLFTATTIVASLLITPIYEAETTIWIEEMDTSSLFPTMAGLPVSGELKTQCEVLKSRIIAEEVVKRLGLDKKMDEGGSLFSFIKERILHLEGENPSEEERFIGAVFSLQRRTRVEPIRNTDLIRLKVQDEDPTRAMEIANTMADVFVDLNLKFERGEARSIYEFTKAQIKATKERLRKAEEALKRYKETSGISVLDEETRGEVQKIVHLEGIYSQTKSARQAAQVRLEDVRTQLAELNERLAIETIIEENKAIKDLKARLVALEMEVSALTKRYGEEDPRVIRAKDRLIETKDRLSAMITDLISRKTSTITPYLPDMVKPIYQELMGTLIRLETEISALEAKEDALSRTLKEYTQRLERLPAKELELARLMREAEVNEKIYRLLLEKHEEARIAEAMKIGNIRIIDPATKPLKPIKPKKTLNTILGAFIGLFVGVGAAFLVEYLDRSIKTVEEAERIANLPIMGVIPTIKPRKRENA